MKFFTRAWTSGEMTEAEAAAVPEIYGRYVATLNLPPAIAALSQVNPHDAFVMDVEHQPEQSRLTLQLRCGDLQRGYFDVTLAFSQVVVDGTALDTLRRAVRPARVEVLYDEVDRSDDCFEYRLLLYPDGEVSIRFRQVELTERPAANRGAG
jgi:hypothetical protein